MDTRDHQEFGLFQRDKKLVTVCRRAISDWVADGKAIAAPDGVIWTPERARSFVEEMGRLFRQYNLVLWRTFSYCRRCQGGCCVVGASQVTVFDALALALLEAPFPELATRAAPGDCIYLGAKGCRWPQTWRPLKCWSFYCLGSGSWTLDAGDAHYRYITEALQDVVHRWLPGEMQRWEKKGRQPHEQFLADPIAFAEALGATLFQLFVAPFCAAYDLDPVSLGRGRVEMQSLTSTDSSLAFIARAVEEVWQGSVAVEDKDGAQMLADLEQLEWLLLARPAGMRRALQALGQRYSVDNPRNAGYLTGPDRLRSELSIMIDRLLDEELAVVQGSRSDADA